MIGSMEAEASTIDVEAGDLVACSARTPEDYKAAYRLRYEVYVAEQQKAYPEADHSGKLFSDELDPDGDTIVVKTADGIVVGTVRANWFDSEQAYAHYADVFDVENFRAIDRKFISVCSRLAASAEHRHARVRELLFETIFQHGLQRDTKLCFATCAPILLRLFRKYGFDVPPRLSSS